jgi:hypothetical protein
MIIIFHFFVVNLTRPKCKLRWVNESKQRTYLFEFSKMRNDLINWYFWIWFGFGFRLGLRFLLFDLLNLGIWFNFFHLSFTFFWAEFLNFLYIFYHLIVCFFKPLRYFIDLFLHIILDLFFHIILDLFYHIVINLVLHLIIDLHLHIINVVLFDILFKILIAFKGDNFFIHSLSLMTVLPNNNVFLLFSTCFVWWLFAIALFLWWLDFYLSLNDYILDFWRFSQILISESTSLVALKINLSNNSVPGVIDCAEPYWLLKLVQSKISNLFWLLNVLW